ncbi:MAG: DUF2461 family protein [Bacteroidales bacterium]|nr:DUF2461 family protein [Bacteroidales bacterium]
MQILQNLKNIITDSSFIKHFGQIDGDKLKSAPKGFDSTFEAIELLKFKSYTVGKKYSDDAILTNQFFSNILQDFETMMPFNVYLNKIIR